MPNAASIDRIKGRLPEGWENQEDTGTFERAKRFLLVRGWKESRSYTNVFRSPEEAIVCLDDQSIIRLEARDEQGYSHVLEQGRPIGELPYLLIDNELMQPECPNCGKSGGAPEQHHSQEFQGCREHGGMIGTVSYGCSLCHRYDAYDAAQSKADMIRERV